MSGMIRIFSAIFIGASIERRATFYARITITVTINSTVTDITVTGAPSPSPPLNRTRG